MTTGRERDAAEPDCIGRFEAHARTAPERPAVVCDDHTLTYGVLDARANQLAHVLAEHLAPGALVAVCLPRTLDLPVALLATLKAGGVYVPLDPELPTERLRHLLRDTRAALLVTHTSLGERLASAEDAYRVITVDTLSANIDAAPTHAPHVARPAHERAYVMYTSGSTGAPKGVEVEHGALSARYPFSPYKTLLAPGDVLAAVTAVSWNPSVYEVLYTLASGATLALASHAIVRDPRHLARFLDDHGITFMRAVPSLWQSLVDAGWAGRPELAIVCHGERLTAPLAARLAGLGKHLSNTWGATEASVFSVVELTAEGRRVIPLTAQGDSDSRVVVLGPDLTPADVNEAGELHLTGPVLARGYLGDPGLSASRFITVASSRIYKSGDIGRRLPDGTIELLGRDDDQVKIRGQRIELGEIEAALLRHPAIAQAVVVAREVGPGDQRLVAYLVAAATLRSDVLRAFLATTLPEHMLPAAFVSLPRLPLGTNGKVDRKALPAPGRARPLLAHARAAPETALQASLASTFGEHLGYADIGIDDDFFALGGHSLLAAQVVARIQVAHDLEVSLATFFAAPTVRALAADIARRKAEGERSRPRTIAPSTHHDAAPLSFAQERLWFLNRLTPDETAYSLPSALELTGPLAVAALEAAIQLILTRHEALRTSFAAGPDGAPRQSVHGAHLSLTRVDLATDRASLTARLRAEAARPFDLAHAPLLRATLFALAPEHHVLFINMHHIASDGWSQALFRRELALAYDALAAGLTPALPELPIQYRDYAHWQRTPESLARLAEQSAYWRRRLAHLESLELPTDRPRPKVFTHAGARAILPLSPALTAALKALATHHGASLYMVLLATFKTLLFRYSGQTDLAVGSPIAGRNAPETACLIGFFVNTLVLRSQVAGDLPFADLLAQVKATALEAWAHQDLPFEHLVGELNPERDLGRHPLIQTMFALQNTPYEALALTGLGVTPLLLESTTTRFDSELHIWERDGALVCHWIYNTDLFDPWRIEQMLRHYATLLDAVCEAPATPLARLPLLSPAEREQIVVTWNATARPYPLDQCVHERFEAHARRTPDALAIATDHERLTYGALDRLADRFASRLHAIGVRAGDRVALCLDRSPALVASIIACTKLGAAYVPLDPAYPDQRLADMLADAHATALVTRHADAPRFAPAIPHVLVDATNEPPDDAPLPRHVASPDDLAYVIYTSGSSGRPNGVAVAHRSLANLACWHCETYALTANDRATLIASPAFDASVWELWPYLIAGASLHIPDPDTRLFPQRLVQWLASHAVTVTFLPTPLLEACLADAIDALAHATTLRAVLTGGDRLGRTPGTKLPFAIVNHYGPTENTVVSTAGVVSDAAQGLPSIGRPIANTQAYILDPALNPVPIGVPGELHVAGLGLARGYLDCPSLTAERFIANPFDPFDPSGRLYKTGDLARYLPDGAIAFLGRRDAQVKIRGVRIEPGEIDAAIAAHPGIREVVTIAREDVPGDKRLVSYLVADRHSPELDRAHVAQWQTLYDNEYTGARGADPELDVTGWNSSLTGAPIPDAEMREWVDATLAAFTRGRPERILEIGCGTGLLLYRLAPNALHYRASDFSRAAISAIQRHVARTPDRFTNLELAIATAHDLTWLDPEARSAVSPSAAVADFDAVILNSVVQYFPSADYLFDVLSQLVTRVAPGGRIFLGDVRNLDLLPAFQRALRHFGAPASRDDKELLLSPAFFHHLRERLPAVTAVAVRPRRGRARNEMSMFRCDVTLHIDAAPQPISAELASLTDLPAQLDAQRGQSFLVRGLADARTSDFLDAGLAGIDVEALHALAARTNHHADLRLGRDSQTIDALFVPLALLRPDQPIACAGFHEPIPAKGSALASDPLRRAREDALVQCLRSDLGKRLPDALIPSAFVFLDALPLTPNDKLDRRALPAPTSDRSPHLGALVAPTTPTEAALARIFGKALGTQSIGRDDNFFELGGHSLLAVQVVARIEDHFALSLPLATLFQAPTLATLARHLDTLPQRAPLATPATDVAPPDDATRLPLAPVDIAFHYARVFFAHAPNFLYQVLELRLAAASPTDPTRLAAALLYAVNHHPIARGRISSRSALGKAAYWDVGARLGKAPLEVHEARDETHADALRDAVVASPFPLDEAPSFRFVLLRSAIRDRLLVRYNHGAVDASGLQCMLASIMSHYLGRPDPAQRTTPFTTRELLDYYAHAAPILANNELAHLASLLPTARTRPFAPRTSLLRPRAIFPARIHPLGGDPADTTCARVELRFTRSDTEQLEATARTLRTTLDRVFLVGLLTGADRHNRTLAPRDDRRIEAYWAVNLRPPRYYQSIVANHFSWSRVRLPDTPTERAAWREHMLDPAADFLLRGALDWLKIVDGFHNQALPLALRRLCMRGMELSAPSFVISNTLSFGTLGDDPLARDFGVQHADLHARYGFTDRPVIVIGQRDGRFHLRMVYPRAIFDEDGARRFLATCIASTLNVS